MTRNSRVSAYECSFSPGAVSEAREIKAEYVSKGRHLWGRYGGFIWDDLARTIKPEIRDKRIAGWPFNLPILITTHQLVGSSLPSSRPFAVTVPYCPARRRKDARTEVWEAIIDKTWRVIKVVGKNPWEASSGQGQQ